MYLSQRSSRQPLRVLVAPVGSGMVCSLRKAFSREMGDVSLCLFMKALLVAASPGSQASPGSASGYAGEQNALGAGLP